ncbi:MAG: SRPBCC domain-containing protein [Alphaproteobacteria bacterium]|nr:SRPBCC domain-containing protein [Alphaproteobacteria bacterium]
MNDFQCKFKIHAEPKKVYEAISTQHGLQGWWTVDCDAESKEGSKATLRFGETYTVMWVEKLIPNKQIRWKCLEQHHVADRPLQKQDEWVGTHLIFDIKDNGSGGTELNFTHQGLNESLECYDICEERWGHFLKKSLKSYVESGKGDPYDN